MNQTIQLIIMVIVLVGVVGGYLLFVPYLKSKGVNVSTLLANADKVTQGLDKTLTVINEVLPGNPAVEFLTIIEKWAKIGVGNAEQLCVSGVVTDQERATIASQTVYSVLDELKIDIDDNKKVLIDAAIKEAVLKLGHTKDAIVKVASIPVEVAKTETIIATKKLIYVDDNGAELVPAAAKVETTDATGNATVAINTPIVGQPIA